VVNELADIRNGVCVICRLRNPILEREPTQTRTFQLRCARCGTYDLTFDAVSELNSWLDDAPLRPIIAEWIWEQNSLGITPRISSETLVTLKSRRQLPFLERAKRLLIYLADHTTTLGSNVSYGGFPPVTAMLQTLKVNEVAVVARFLADEGLIENVPEMGYAKVLGDGFIRADEWKVRAVQSAQGFVAMWFDQTTTDAWERGLRKGISDAGYAPLRVDKAEHINKICDEIVAQIRRSRFLVADYTGHRSGVYYEAGYAAGREIPVFLTCQKSEMDKLHLIFVSSTVSIGRRPKNWLIVFRLELRRLLVMDHTRDDSLFLE